MESGKGPPANAEDSGSPPGRETLHATGQLSPSSKLLRLEPGAAATGPAPWEPKLHAERPLCGGPEHRVLEMSPCSPQPGVAPLPPPGLKRARRASAQPGRGLASPLQLEKPVWQ